jgi:hypothetical protein
MKGNEKMKKENVFIAVVSLFLAILIMPVGASALTISDFGTKLTANSFTYFDTGKELVQLTDTDGTNDDSTVLLFMEDAGFASSNILGIYDPNSFNILQVFSGPDSPFDSVTLAFDLATGTVTNNNTGLSASIGSTFGFYLTNGVNQTFYSQVALNPDRFDHFRLFDTSDNKAGSLIGSDVIMAIEDLYGGGDRDYNDMVAGANDLKPVSEPGTLLLFGSALIGLAFFRRRK